MPHLTATVEIELTKVSGKFVSKDALAEAIQELLESAQDAIYADDSEYETETWEVTVL